MKKKRILICGASGFIGRNLYEALSKKKDLEVMGVYHTKKISGNTNLIKADLTRREDARRITRGIDIVIQAAATTSGAKDIVTRPYYHVTDNVIMNALLFQAAYENRVSKVIFFSCTVMYPQLNRPVLETDLDLNDTMNGKYFGVGWTKIYIERLCEFYSRLGRSKFIVIRHSNIYGSYDKFDLEKSHVFGATITKIMNAKDDKIVVWGEGKEERDLLYISDLVDFVKKAIDKDDDFDIVNVGSGKSISVTDLVNKIIKVVGKNVCISYDKTKPNIGTKLVLDIRKAKRRYGWYPKVDLDEGIKKTLNWYEKNIKN